MNDASRDPSFYLGVAARRDALSMLELLLPPSEQTLGIIIGVLLCKSFYLRLVNYLSLQNRTEEIIYSTRPFILFVIT